jgi:hypothetical protein
MTRERKKFEIDEHKREFLSRNPLCEICGAPAVQLAHRIPQTKTMLRLYGPEVIHHDLNLAAVCSLKHNAAVNIQNRPVRIVALVQQIQRELTLVEGS